MKTRISPLALCPAPRFLAAFALSLVLFGTTLAPPALAEGFALYEWSARGIALGGAVMGRKPDASAVAYNPALITKLPGTHVMAGMSTVTPAGKVSTTVNNTTDYTSADSKTWFVPHLYITQQITDRLTLGYAQFSRFGLGFHYDESWPGNESVYGVNLQTMSFNPNLAVKVTEAFSAAVGVEVIYVSLDLKKKSKPFSHPIIGTPQIDVDIKGARDVGVGGNIALHYQIDDQWAVGVSYRSPITVKARGKGKFTFDNRDEVLNVPMGPPGSPTSHELIDSTFENSDATGVVTFPESVAFGLSWSPVKEFSLEAGAIWTRWSRFKNLDINFPSSIGMQHGPKDWSNSWRFNIGAEYDVTDWLALRVGYVYDRSPMTEAYEDYLVPTSSRHIYSVGAGVTYENWTVDAAYAYLDLTGRDYDNNPRSHVLNGRSQASDTHITSLSIGYKF